MFFSFLLPSGKETVTTGQDFASKAILPRSVWGGCFLSGLGTLEVSARNTWITTKALYVEIRRSVRIPLSHGLNPVHVGIVPRANMQEPCFPRVLLACKGWRLETIGILQACAHLLTAISHPSGLPGPFRGLLRQQSFPVRHAVCKLRPQFFAEKLVPWHVDVETLMQKNSFAMY